MVVSVVCHVVAIGGLAWFLSDSGSGTTEITQSRSVAMAIVHRMPDRTRYMTEPEAMSPAASSSASTASSSSTSNAGAAPSAIESASQSKPTPPFDLDSIIAALDSGASTSLSGSDGGDRPGTDPSDLVSGRIRTGDGRSIDQLGDDELIPGRARVGLGAGQTTTQVFGVSGTGSTFVYVFDRSESMLAAGGAPLRALKSELIRSLDTLTERQQFQIIFYNDKAEVFKAFGDRVGLVTGEEGTIARAKQFVRGTVAIGGTEHSVALKMAMQLAPDVVFFLTDAKIQTMSDNERDEISRRAESAGTTIHGIQFGTGPQPRDSFVERLAKQNRGGFRYLDVTSLGRP